MSTRLTRFLAAGALGVALLSSASFASAAGLTSSQVQSIMSLLSAFGADKATITNVYTALMDSTPPPASTCVNLFQDLTLGATDASTGGAVTELQTFLQSQGYFTYTGPKGYYGFITAQAVGQYQMAKGLVSSSNDSAYGITGPQTRSSMSCGSPRDGTMSSDFSVSPSSGAAPLTVTFSVPQGAGASNWLISFGDGKSGSISSMAGGSSYFSHTYTSPGMYTATLENASGYPIATQTITVTNNQTNSSFTASPTSGAAPMTATFSASNDSNGSIDFGDGNSVQLLSLFGNGTSDPHGYCGAAPDFFCSVPHAYAQAGTYTATLKDSSGNVLGTQTITVTSSQNQPTATIDQSSLTSYSGTATLSGTASGVSQIGVVLSSETTNDKVYGSGPVSIVNGRWSVVVSPALASGVYKVAVEDNATTQILAQGNLIIGMSIPETASIDQSSLSITSGNPVITGSASGVSSVFVVIANGATQEGNSQGTVPVVNGRWNSGTIYAKASGSSFPAGTYTVSVYGGGMNGPLLTSGTLTVADATPLTCSLFATPNSVLPNQVFTLQWASTGATAVAGLRYIPANDVNGSQAMTTGATGPQVYSATFSNASGQTTSCSTTVYASNTTTIANTPGLHAVPNQPFTLSGYSSLNGEVLQIAVVSLNQTDATDWNTISGLLKGSNTGNVVGNGATVSNNSWSASFSGLPEGTYNVLIFDKAGGLVAQDVFESTYKG